jgi:hypothetical protein
MGAYSAHCVLFATPTTALFKIGLHLYAPPILMRAPTRLELPVAPSKPMDCMLPTFTDCCGRQSGYLHMKHHLENSGVRGFGAR